MIIKDIKDLDTLCPGLVIKEDGTIITMNDENHDQFFQNIIGTEYRKQGKNARQFSNESNLGVLFYTIINELNFITYKGCSTNDNKRVYDGGILYTPPLKNLTNEQLSSLVATANKINDNYHADIITVGDINFGDSKVNISDIKIEQKLRSCKAKTK